MALPLLPSLPRSTIGPVSATHNSGSTRVNGIDVFGADLPKASLGRLGYCDGWLCTQQDFSGSAG